MKEKLDRFFYYFGNAIGSERFLWFCIGMLVTACAIMIDGCVR